jgi:general secretion pathway protein C
MMTLNIQELNQRYLFGGTALLGLLVVCTFMYVAFNWYQDWQLAHKTFANTSKIDSNTNSKLIAAIPSQHLFGLAATGDMPITNLELRVTGIVRQANAQHENTSKAYISIAGAPSKIYQVGDTLPDGVKIYDITTDTVILENSGQLEKLPLPREKLQFKPRSTEETN